MSAPLSPATQAILLLCSPLRAGRDKNAPTLTTGEFNELETSLQRAGESLELLLESVAGAWLKSNAPALDAERIEGLLGRGFMLSMALETWQSAGVWLAGRGEPDYPERWLRLKHIAPPLVYGCGPGKNLSRGGLAIVGSRDVDPEGEEFTRRVASLAAEEKLQVVSGGARGVDQIAMLACLETGGTVSGVLADSLLRSAASGTAREAIQDGRLTLISPFDPEAGFNVGNAMQRNKLIYALADFGLVVSAGSNEGGTWTGAVEQLEKLRLTPVFVRGGGAVPEGNRQLLKRGAIEFPPAGTAPMRRFFEQESFKAAKPMETAELFALQEQPAAYLAGAETAPAKTRKRKALK